MNSTADLNSTASANRIHIGFFGCRNAGKSSLVNAVTGQDLSVVSDIKGTTTDPVMKSMELLPLGPVVIIDTPGYDDTGMLGDLRVRRTRQTLNRTDIAVLVADASAGLSPDDRQLLALFAEKQIPHLVAFNKCDLLDAPAPADPEAYSCGAASLFVSALTGQGVAQLKEMLGALAPSQDASRSVISGLISPGRTALLVCPIDKAAPKGRLIMPQQMTIRALLDEGCAALITTEADLPRALDDLASPPAIVITDSQVFRTVARLVADEIPLTSFSILMARCKGFLAESVRAVQVLENLKDGDRILMAEGCTHHRQCKDIGTVKIPAWLRAHCHADFQIETCSGRDFPEDPGEYRAIIHCGGCMITEREMSWRMKCAIDRHVPFTNYGIVIAHMMGILERSLRPFPDVHALLAERGGTDNG